MLADLRRHMVVNRREKPNEGETRLWKWRWAQRSQNVIGRNRLGAGQLREIVLVSPEIQG